MSANWNLNIPEAILAALIDGIRTQSAKKGLALGLSDVIANVVSSYGMIPGIPYGVSSQNLIMEPVIGALIYSVANGLIIGKDNYLKNFFVALVELEAAAGFSVALMEFNPQLAV